MSTVTTHTTESRDSHSVGLCNQLVDIDESYSRKSLGGSKILARFEGGETPSFLIGEPQYTHAEILSILSGPEWTREDAYLSMQYETG